MLIDTDSEKRLHDVAGIVFTRIQNLIIMMIGVIA